MRAGRAHSFVSTGVGVLAALGSILLTACADAQMAEAPVPSSTPSGSPTMTTTTTINTSPSTLSVRGQSELRKPADQVQIAVGVISENAEAGAALADNSRRMRAIVDAISKVGLTTDDFQTGRFQIRPQYSRRPRQAEQTWKPQIIGYEVTNTVVIKTTRLELTGELIEAANDAGANSIDRLQFGLADSRQFRAEAITTAARNARTDARVLAEASGVVLVRPLSITLDGAMPRPPSGGVARAMAASVESSAPPMTPGDVTVTASVSIVYEIKPAE